MLEIAYAHESIESMPRGVLGMNAAMMEEYLHFIANRRLNQLRLSEQYPGAQNPFVDVGDDGFKEGKEFL